MSLRVALTSLLSSLGPLAKPTVTTVLKVWQPDKPELAELVGQMFELGEKALDDNDEWKKGIEEKVHATRHDLTIAAEILEILGTHTADLLKRVADLERQPEEAEELVELQLVEAPWAATIDAVRRAAERLDSHQKRLDDLAAGQDDMRPLIERGLSAADFVAELRAEGLTPTLLRDLRKFRQAVRAVAENRPAEAEQLLNGLAVHHPNSAAVRVGLAAAQMVGNDFLNADRSLKTAVKLKPADAKLKGLSQRATELSTRHTPVARSRTAARTPKAGDTLDGWKLSALHARGGMGKVFRASRGSQTGALKVMHPELSTDFDRREQFEHEMMALMKLERHPSLVSILRFGKCDNFGCWYFVMPLVDGPTLTKHLADAGPLTAERALTLFRGLAGGLAVANARGLIHRDLKPDNLIVSADGHLVLVDFGLAAEAGVSGHTQAAGVSTLFAAPEHLRNNVADQRADVYSFGATLYYSLKYAPADLRDPEMYEPDHVPAEFRDLLTRCLERNPKKRPAHAGELMELFDPPTTSNSPQPVSPTRERGPNHPSAEESGPRSRVGLTGAGVAGVIGANPVGGEAPQRKRGFWTSLFGGHDTSLNPTLVVCAAGTGQYREIAKAVKAAKPGTLIKVKPGTYRKRVVIDKNVELVADGPREEVIVEVANTECLLLKSDRITVRGFTIRQIKPSIFSGICVRMQWRGTEAKYNIYS